MTKKAKKSKKEKKGKEAAAAADGHKQQASGLAAIRWYTNILENEALQNYLDDVSSLDDIAKVMVGAIRRMRSLRQEEGDDPIDDCPWPRCPDKSCAPQCIGNGD